MLHYIISISAFYYPRLSLFPKLVFFLRNKDHRCSVDDFVLNITFLFLYSKLGLLLVAPTGHVPLSKKIL
jgi:hypothetical protein